MKFSKIMKNHGECRFGALLVAITISAVMLQPVASADDATWDGGGGDALWSNTSNWGGVPAVPGIGNTATFNAAAGAGGAVIDLGGGVTVRQIVFDAASVAAYTIGAGALTLGDAANAGTISVASTVGNNQTFNSAITLGNSGTTASYSFGNAATAQILTFNGNITGGSGGTAGTKTLTINAAGAITVNGAISTGGATTVALTKSGTGTVTLGGANSYSGTTTVSAGTLVLNADASLATTGTLTFSGSGTLSLAGNQTLVNVTVANSQTGTVTGGGGLTLSDVTSFKVGGTASGTSQTLTLSGLGNFTYSGGGAVSVGGQLSGNNTRTIGTLTLPNNSTITASTFGVANVSNSGNSSQANNTNLGTLTLSGSTTINTGAITLGANQANGVLQYSGATNPTLKLRAANGTDAVTTMTVGQGGGNGNGYTTSCNVDLVTGVTGTSTLDASVDTLTIGHCNRTTTATGLGGTVNGTFTMGAGTLTVATMVLGSTTTFGNTSNSQTVNGTFTIGAGGVVEVTTLTLVNQINTTGFVKLNGTFNLNGGADLYTQTIQPGSTTAGTITRTFNWNNGTIHNLAGTDLTVSSGLTLTMASGGTHAFDIDNGQTGTISADITGASQSLTKAGAGTLVLAGAISYTGATAINDGTLTIDTSGSQTLSGDISGSGALVKNGTGTLTLSGSNSYSGDTTVNDGTLIVGSGKLPSSTSLRIAASGVVDLSGGNTVRRLYIGGEMKAGGVWGSESSGAANPDSHFSGTGTLTVTESGENQGTVISIR